MATGITAAGITAAMAVLGTTFQVGSMISSAKATKEERAETIEDYWAAIEETKIRSEESRGEAERRIGTLKEEGVLSLKEQGAQAAFEGRVAMTQAEMVASSEEARLGSSGVRAKGSPLLAAQQNVDLAFAAADRTIEKGKAEIGIAGVKLKTGLADIEAASSLLTEQYARQQEEYLRKIRQLGGTISGEYQPMPMDSSFNLWSGGFPEFRV